MSWFNQVIRFFQDGGFWMYPIMLVMVLGLAVALERYVYLTAQRAANQGIWSRVFPLLQKGDYKQAYEAVAEAKCAMARIIAYGLAKLAGNVAGRRRDDIEMAMEEGLMEIIPRLERRTPYLATLANMATLLGLLGTIIGLISAFDAVSNADPAEKASLLSTSISVAMNTTAFGLIVAIPLLLIHAVIQSKTTQIVDSLEMATVRVLNIVDQQPRAPGAAPAAAAATPGRPG
jgi:biopolymer transport protein ExbB/TolQ